MRKLLIAASVVVLAGFIGILAQPKAMPIRAWLAANTYELRFPVIDVVMVEPEAGVGTTWAIQIDPSVFRTKEPTAVEVLDGIVASTQFWGLPSRVVVVGIGFAPGTPQLMFSAVCFPPEPCRIVPRSMTIRPKYYKWPGTIKWLFWK